MPLKSEAQHKFAALPFVSFTRANVNLAPDGNAGSGGAVGAAVGNAVGALVGDLVAFGAGVCGGGVEVVQVLSPIVFDWSLLSKLAHSSHEWSPILHPEQSGHPSPSVHVES